MHGVRQRIFDKGNFRNHKYPVIVFFKFFTRNCIIWLLKKKKNPHFDTFRVSSRVKVNPVRQVDDGTSLLGTLFHPPPQKKKSFSVISMRYRCSVSRNRNTCNNQQQLTGQLTSGHPILRRLFSRRIFRLHDKLPFVALVF